MAFAHHIRPQNTAAAAEYYRTNFQPSQWADAPRVMLSVDTVCADTDADAESLARPVDIMRLAVILHEQERSLPTPQEAVAHVFTAEEEEALAGLRDHLVRGDAETVAGCLIRTAARYEADELMLVTPIYDPKDRVRSFELIARPSLIRLLPPDVH